MISKTTPPYQRSYIFPRPAFSRIGVPVVQPPAGSIKPNPSQGHSQVRGIWR